MNGIPPTSSAPREASSAPTLNDVAARAGVGTMTASRALSGSSKVSPEKVLLVMKAAAALGYRRNENARSLRPGQRTGLVGVIITNASNPYYAEMQLGIEQLLATQGSRTLVGNTGDDVAREQRLISDFVGWHVDGLIVVPAGNSVDHLSALQQWETPLVLASRRSERLDVDTVLIDDVGGTYSAVLKLLAEGHIRIAFLGLGMSVSTSARRLKGFTDAHARAGRVVDTRLIFSGSSESGSAVHAAKKLFATPDIPTAVFCANNRNTIALMHALGEFPTSSRHTLRVVAFDNFDTADLMPIHLSIVDHDAREMGRQAAQLLVERLGGYTGPARRLELPTHYLP